MTGWSVGRSVLGRGGEVVEKASMYGFVVGGSGGILSFCDIWGFVMFGR